MNRAATILLIDDDQRNIFALSAVLKTRGYTVVSASNARDAFTILEGPEQIGIILMDMMMPEMDGYEAIPRIKTDGRFASIPVIAVTAQAMPGDREKSIAAGADGYVAKPVDIDLLITMIHEHLK
jgi:two-component system cell cycle response regulator DivK